MKKVVYQKTHFQSLLTCQVCIQIYLLYLQLSKVDIGGVEGEADGEAELGVHQQGDLVLRLLHRSLLGMDHKISTLSVIFHHLQATLNLSDKGRADPFLKLICKRKVKVVDNLNV